MESACTMHWTDKNIYEVLVGNLKERKHSEDLGVDEEKILDLALGK
jgi:hypothetical protein